MSKSNFWVPLIVVVVAVGCMYVLFSAGEAKNKRLTEEARDYSTTLANEQNAREKAERELVTLRNLRAEDDRRVAVLAGQIKTLQEQNERIVSKSNNNVRIAEKNEQRLKEARKEDAKNFQLALKQYKQQIEERDRRIKNLMDGREKEDAEKIDCEFKIPPDKNDKPAPILDANKVESCVAAYQATWNELCNARGDFSDTPKASEKTLLLAKYDRCLAKVIELQKQANDVTVDEDVYDRIISAYNATVGLRRDTTSPIKGRRMDAMLTQRPIDKLLTAWITELKDQRKQVEDTSVKRKKGKVYDANIIRAYP